MNRILLLIFTIFSRPALAGLQSIVSECYSGSQAEAWVCFEKAEQETDALLNREVSEFESALKNWDESETYRKKALDEFQRYWKKTSEFASARAEF